MKHTEEGHEFNYCTLAVLEAGPKKYEQVVIQTCSCGAVKFDKVEIDDEKRK